MKRREFFSTLTKATFDVLGVHPFHGTLEGVAYTFVPAQVRRAPTLIVVGVRLQEALYRPFANMIFLTAWPDKTASVFWRKVLMRHDLTDDLSVVCRALPAYSVPFVKKMIWLTSSTATKDVVVPPVVPTLVLVETDNTAGQELSPTLDGFVAGSDVFVGVPGGLNDTDSPTFGRVLSFVKEGAGAVPVTPLSA